MDDRQSLSWRRVAFVAACALSVLTACGSDPEPAAPSDGGETPTTARATATTGGSGGTGGTGGGGSSDGCPVSAADLSTATSLTWELQERRENHPLETDESITATICLFTAPEARQFGDDPLVLRTDVVTGADAATERGRFGATCTDNGGTTQPSGGGTVCERAGVTVEGIKGEGDRLVSVYFVNADTSTAADLTPSFAQLLAAVD